MVRNLQLYWMNVITTMKALLISNYYPPHSLLVITISTPGSTFVHASYEVGSTFNKFSLKIGMTLVADMTIKIQLSVSAWKPYWVLINIGIVFNLRVGVVTYGGNCMERILGRKVLPPINRRRIQVDSESLNFVWHKIEHVPLN